MEVRVIRVPRVVGRVLLAVTRGMDRQGRAKKPQDAPAAGEGTEDEGSGIEEEAGP